MVQLPLERLLELSIKAALLPILHVFLCMLAPELLQSANMQLINPASMMLHLVARAVMDSGNQWTYVASHLRDQLNLPTNYGIRRSYYESRHSETLKPGIHPVMLLNWVSLLRRMSR